MTKKNTQLPQPVRNYRDTIFRMLFREKRELLSLFNAIHGTAYDDPEELEIATLENAVYMSMKNDNLHSGAFTRRGDEKIFDFSSAIKAICDVPAQIAV